MKVAGNKMASKPFLKWAGGKYKLVEFIKENFPDKPYGRFVEPFAGSAAGVAGAVSRPKSSRSFMVNRFSRLM